MSYKHLCDPVSWFWHSLQHQKSVEASALRIHQRWFRCRWSSQGMSWMFSWSFCQCCISEVIINNRSLLWEMWAYVPASWNGEEKLQSRHQFYKANCADAPRLTLCFLNCSFYPSPVWNTMYHFSGNICFFPPFWLRVLLVKQKWEKNISGIKTVLVEKEGCTWIKQKAAHFQMSYAWIQHSEWQFSPRMCSRFVW